MFGGAGAAVESMFATLPEFEVLYVSKAGFRSAGMKLTAWR
jgi:hypothetical protein